MKQNKKKCDLLFRLLATVTLCLGVVLFQVSPVLADDPIDGSVDPSVGADEPADTEEAEDLVSNFQNPAQAAHASQLAGAVASAENTAVEEAMTDVDKATEDFENATAANDQEAIDEAQEALDAAVEAHGTVVSNLTGITQADIADMREAGMGWGNIAREIGVHPSVIGLGHTKDKQKSKAGFTADPNVGTVAGSIQAGEVAEATARNTKSGYAKGHGLAMNTGVDSQVSGLGIGVASKSRGQGLGGASGLGSGQGQTGNSGSRGDTMGGGNNSSASSPGNSSNSSSNKGGVAAGVAGKDGSPGNSGNSNSNGKENSSKDKSSKSNNGKGNTK
ncbi:MAG: helix-turn-helix domain-containing protein [Desulfocapsa sp.]|nr:helix-turn-helix domain-containing protein [Desulfocapsa sp.]